LVPRFVTPVLWRHRTCGVGNWLGALNMYHHPSRRIDEV